MGYLEGLLQGFNERHQQYRDEQMQLERERNQRETAVFNTLLSSPDPEIQSLAATGMITGAMGPSRKGGLSGWIGDMTQNPIMGQIRNLIATPVTTPAALPSRNITGIAAGAPGSASEVSTQTTRAGEPGPESTNPDAAIPYRTAIPPTVAQPPPTAPAPITNLQTGPLSAPKPTTSPRHVFATPEELAAQHYRGEYGGEVEGIIAGLMKGGMSQADAAKVASEHFMRSRGLMGAGLGTLQLVHGTDANGNPASGVFDKRPGSPTYGKIVNPDTGEEIRGFVQGSVTAPRATDREGMARELFGKPFSQLTQDEAAQVNARMVQFHGELAGAGATGRQTALSTAPLTREQLTAETGRLTQQWNQNTAPIRTAQQAQAKMHAAVGRLATDPNGAAQEILSAFGEIANPQSGVGTSEFARTAQGQPIVDRLSALFQKYAQTGGQGVTPEELQSLAQTADALVAALTPWQASFRTQIEAQARTAGIADPSSIFGESTSQIGQPPPTSAPITPPTVGVSPRVGTSPTGASAAPAGGIDDYEIQMVNGVATPVKRTRTAAATPNPNGRGGGPGGR